jgi:hypothetical protein
MGISISIAGLHFTVHSKIVDIEHNLYLKMSVKRSLACSWALLFTYSDKHYTCGYFPADDVWYIEYMYNKEFARKKPVLFYVLRIAITNIDLPINLITFMIFCWYSIGIACYVDTHLIYIFKPINGIELQVVRNTTCTARWTMWIQLP